MSYKSSQDDILEYLRLDSPDNRRRVKRDMNDAVRRFMNWRYWQETMFTTDIAIDGTLQYDLAALVGRPVHRIRDVYVKENTTTAYPYDGEMTEGWTRLSLQDYNRAKDKTRRYAIDKGFLYANGTGFNLTIFYQSPGEGFPMSADTDNPEVLQNYTDIIEKWTQYLFLKWFGEDNSAAIEKQDLAEMLQLEKKREAREEKRGRMIRVSSHNRY